MVQISFDVFNTMLEELLNLGMQLWGRDRVLVPLYVNRVTAQTPLGTSVVLDVQQRTLMRPSPVAVVSDQGGDAALAFDGDLSTACLQIAPLGFIGATYPAPGVEISNYGVFFTRAGEYAWMIEYTTDPLGLDWQACDAVVQPMQAGTWIWRELDGMPS